MQRYQAPALIEAAEAAQIVSMVRTSTGAQLDDIGAQCARSFMAGAARFAVLRNTATDAGTLPTFFRFVLSEDFYGADWAPFDHEDDAFECLRDSYNEGINCAANAWALAYSYATAS